MQAPKATIKPDYRKKPILSYCGLTIVMSNPSRFDSIDLLSANGGYFFCREALAPDLNRMRCDIRLKDNKEPLMEGTKCVLLLGEPAARQWLEDDSLHLGSSRGAPYLVNSIPHIASYQPQDACDITGDHENKFNPYLNKIRQNSIDEFGDSDNEGDEIDEKTRHGRTKRKSFRFWLSADVAKCKRIIANKGNIPSAPFQPEYKFYPDSATIINALTKTKDELLFIDIETDSSRNMLCFSFSFSYGPIYMVPCLLHNYSWAYSYLPQIYRALAVAMRDNTTVAHNGSGFDFFVLATKYNLPIGKRVADTMLMQHRCFPEVEKSLGHCISLWTNEPFHKDEADFSYMTPDACNRLWTYNGKDVYTMMLIYKAIMQYATTQPGLMDSIQQACDSIRPYLTCSLQGIRYDETLRASIMLENDKLMMQYLRMIDILIGPETAKTLRRRFKSGMPGSNPQCIEYFHNMLGYSIIAYGKTNKRDGKRKPSLGKKALLKLRLKHDNPVIDICLAYREVAKESGSLKFTPYKEDTNATLKNCD